MSKVQNIIEEIKGLSLLEASELVKGLEQAFGVSAAAAAVAAAPAAGGGGGARPQLLPKRKPSSV
jgi:large subunit ribosomal protein L7/L12